jgi:hypothetical protein
LHDVLSQEKAGRFAAAAGSSRAQRLPRAGDLDRFNLERPLRRRRATLRPRQPAWHAIAQQQIGLPGNAAEIADTGELPIEPNRADEGGVGDLIITDVVHLQSAGIGVAQQHVARSSAAEIAHARELPVQADGAHEVGAGDLIVADIVNLDPAGIDVAQDHVGLAAAREIAEPHDLPIHSHTAEEGGVGDEIVADVVDLEAAGAVAQEHVAGVAAEEAAETRELPIGSDLTQLVARQDRIVADVVNLIGAVGAGRIMSAVVPTGGGGFGIGVTR